MGQTVSNLAGSAMRLYDKAIHSQIFTKNVLFNNILRNVAHTTGAVSSLSSTQGGGKQMIVHYLRNVGSAAGSETLTLPTAGNQGYMQANIPMKFNFHQISITDVALQASKKSKEFLVDVLQTEYNGAKDDMQRQLSRQGYSLGTGVICLANGTISTLTVNVDTPMVGKNPTDYLEVGNGVCFDSSTTTASAVFGVIASITDGDTFALTADPSYSDNDMIFLAHTNGGTPTISNRNAEIMGLKGLIDDASYLTTLQGISRSSYPWWSSYVDDSTSQRSLNEALMHSTLLEAMKKGEPKYGLTSFDVMSALGQLWSGDRRYTDKMELAGGFKGVSFNGLTLVADYDHPYDELNWIDPSVLSVEDLGPISFLDSDGSILSRSSTTPAWNATLKYYANLAISKPNRCSSLRDIIK